MVPQAAQSDHRVCTHGPRSRDRMGVCIPCRDGQVFCKDCGTQVSVGDWLMFGRRCEPCFDVAQRNAELRLDSLEALADGLRAQADAQQRSLDRGER